MLKDCFYTMICHVFNDHQPKIKRKRQEAIPEQRQGVKRQSYDLIDSSTLSEGVMASFVSSQGIIRRGYQILVLNSCLVQTLDWICRHWELMSVGVEVNVSQNLSCA